jgi:hypothetical protein
MSNANRPASAGRVQVHLPAGLEPVYSNFTLITNSPSEIVLDFAQVMPQVPLARVRSRVVMTAINAKLLLRALTEHIARFESQYGVIPVPEGRSLADNLFRGPHSDEPPGPEGPGPGEPPKG